MNFFTAQDDRFLFAGVSSAVFTEQLQRCWRKDMQWIPTFKDIQNIYSTIIQAYTIGDYTWLLGYLTEGRSLAVITEGHHLIRGLGL